MSERVSDGLLKEIIGTSEHLGDGYFSITTPHEEYLMARELLTLRSAHGQRWISVEERLPSDTLNVIVWIQNQTHRGGYWDLASYGEWFCEDENCHPGDPNYVADNDEGNRRGFGWHREEETHGGPYDYVTVDLNGRVTFWMPLPSPPDM